MNNGGSGSAPCRAVMTFISSARMYAVSPEAEAVWASLIDHVAADADTSFAYLTYEAPRPLERLWRRPDVGCVQMCGYPIALRIADVVPLAAPVPAFKVLADTFSGTAGWTVEHSHSGFNALRHHLLPYRSGGRSRLYRRCVGGLVTARRVLESVADGTIDVGPLDAYWHLLARKYLPAMTEGIRVLESTATAPMPAFVAAPALPEETIHRLRDAFSAAHRRPWFDRFREALLIERFVPVTRRDFDQTLAWDRAARDAGYLVPA